MNTDSVKRDLNQIQQEATTVQEGYFSTHYHEGLREQEEIFSLEEELLEKSRKREIVEKKTPILGPSHRGMAELLHMNLWYKA